jgi:hypothetical protein
MSVDRSFCIGVGKTFVGERIMKKAGKAICLVIVCVMAVANVASADIFGVGTVNEFTIDFVPISGSTNPTSGILAGMITFTGVNYDYRMGIYEISNAQWTKFKAAYGEVKGNPTKAYDRDPIYVGESLPTNGVSWYEAAQFVNYLNTSKGYQSAYKFTGTQDTSNYTFTNWVSTDTGYNADNPCRNSNAKYFLPTENEWVKAAYWNGSNLQTFATKTSETLFQGNGVNGGWNYNYCTIYQPWNVGNGSQELNGTYDMMGNVWEWLESGDSSYRGLRGGSWDRFNAISLTSYYTAGYQDPSLEDYNIGFRVASIPEPVSLLLLGLGGLICRKNRFYSK